MSNTLSRDPWSSAPWSKQALARDIREYPDFDVAYLRAAYPTRHADDHANANVRMLETGLVKSRVKHSILARLSCYYTWRGDPLKALDYAVGMLTATSEIPHDYGSPMQTLIFLSVVFEKVGLPQVSAKYRDCITAELGPEEATRVEKITTQLAKHHNEEVIWAATMLK